MSHVSKLEKEQVDEITLSHSGQALEEKTRSSNVWLLPVITYLRTFGSVAAIDVSSACRLPEAQNYCLMGMHVWMCSQLAQLPKKCLLTYR
uniref:Uncharacterized protein n=1 Tax=Ascaris lumbricoides TaxID=6252 RepID=A0A0M3HWW2_ASCLU